jgi:hypothetical protein
MGQQPYQQPQGYPPPGYGAPPQSWSPQRPPAGPWTTRARLAGGLLFGGALLAVVASFLPWGSFSLFGTDTTFNGFEGSDGWLAIGTAIVVLIFGALSFMPVPPRRGIIPISILAGLMLLFIGFANMSEPSSELGSVSDFGGEFSVGFGLWVMVLAGLLVLAGAGAMIASQVAAPKNTMQTSPQAAQYGQQGPYQAPGYQQQSPGGQYPPQPQYPQGQQPAQPPPQPGSYDPPSQPPGEQPPPR